MVGLSPAEEEAFKRNTDWVGLSPAEEEAFKRNTDCVYFLASPLTCKKGSECEYRHSEIARVNPRDCWFWLHANCLNPKCGFRHPPLDGLLGTQTATSTGHSLTPSQNVTTTSSNVPNASSKQAVPCVFFQKGLCLKGDWCPFLHAPNSSSNKAPLVLGTSSSSEPVNFKNSLGGREKFSNEKKVPPVDISNSTKVFQKEKQPAMEAVPSRNEFAVSRRISHPAFGNVFPGLSVTNENSFSWPNTVQQPLLFGEPGNRSNKDVEELSREPSPGFDVLVDDERRGSDYYPNEDQYGLAGEHEVRDGYDIDPATDYSLIPDIDSKRFQDSFGYGMREIHKGRDALEQHRETSERMLGGGYLEKRPYSRADSMNKVDELDLRHRLNKRKKANGLRSVISHEHVGDRKVEDRRYSGFNRNEHNVSLDENHLSSHLQGRIRHPGRSSSPTQKDSFMGYDRVRLSPIRKSSSSYQGRIRDRIKERVGEDLHNGGKNHQGPHFKRDVIDSNNADFSGPKSLAELKNQKIAQPTNSRLDGDQQSLVKRKQPMLDGYLQSGSDVSFEGPRPLEEILKRKRGENDRIVGGKKPSNKGIVSDNHENEGNGSTNISNNKWSPVRSNKDVTKSTLADNAEPEEIRSVAGIYTALQPDPSTVEAEDDTNVVDQVDKDGESDYEQMGGDNFEFYDGENGEADIEYIEDEDEDDFAKKMGLMYS